MSHDMKWSIHVPNVKAVHWDVPQVTVTYFSHQSLQNSGKQEFWNRDLGPWKMDPLGCINNKSGTGHGFVSLEYSLAVFLGVQGPPGTAKVNGISCRFWHWEPHPLWWTVFASVTHAKTGSKQKEPGEFFSPPTPLCYLPCIVSSTRQGLTENHMIMWLTVS